MHYRIRSAFILFMALVFAGCGARKSTVSSFSYVLSFGERGSQEGEFLEPIGILVSGDEVYVSDAGNSRIEVFSRDGAFKRVIGSADASGGGLGRPMHMGILDGDLLVSDYLFDKIVRFRGDGTVVSSFGTGGTEPGQFDAPSSATPDAEGRIYIADFYNQRVQVVDADGMPIREFGIPGETGPAPGQFTYPTAVAMKPGGGFVVADAYNHRIQSFDSTGKFQWKLPDDINWADSTVARFNVATSVAVRSNGDIYVADFYNDRIQVIDMDGRFLESFGTSGSGPGQFSHPTDVAFDKDNNVYVVDFGNSRIQKFAIHD